MLWLMIVVSLVACDRIKNGLGSCLSFKRDPGGQTSGQLLVMATCDSKDGNQNAWIINNTTSSRGSPTYQFCVNSTNLCIGIQGMGRLVQIVANDPSDEAQQWFALDTSVLDNHYINGFSGQCFNALSYNMANLGIVAGTRRCANTAAQRWYFTGTSSAQQSNNLTKYRKS